MLKTWKELNPVEQYCTLLESWMIRGNPRILCEPGGLIHSWIQECNNFVPKIPTQGMDIAEKENADTIRYSVALHGIALMRSFGILSMIEFKPEKGKGWNGCIFRTPFGNALLNALWKVFRANIDTLYYSLNYIETTQTFGILQNALSPLLPEWKRVFPGPEKKYKSGLYSFHVSLSKDCWRRILISDKDCLDSLSSAILDSYNFDNDHLHLFKYTDRFGLPVEILHPYLDEGIYYSSEVLVGEMSLEPGSSLQYVFDLGDKWTFA